MGAHHVVHLVRDILQPTLHRLHAGNHGSNLTANDRLRCQGLSECLALVNPFEALFHYPTLRTGRARSHYPTFVVEIACEIHNVSSGTDKFE
jgi:hypothetical protein